MLVQQAAARRAPLGIFACSVSGGRRCGWGGHLGGRVPSQWWSMDVPLERCGLSGGQGGIGGSSSMHALDALGGLRPVAQQVFKGGDRRCDLMRCAAREDWFQEIPNTVTRDPSPIYSTYGS